MNIIERLNIWYDSLKEPYRFFLFMGMMCLAIFPLQLGLSYHNKTAMLFGLAVYLLMSALAIVRAFGLGRRHRTVGVILLIVMAAITAAVFQQ